MAYAYSVSAHKPTAVKFSQVGNFTGPEDSNLLIAFSTRIEIFLLTPEGLNPMFDVPLYGRICVMKLFRPPGATKDYLLICTERFKICVLYFDPVSREIITCACGDTQDRVGVPCDTNHIGIVDDQCRLVGLHLYEGLVKLIPTAGASNSSSASKDTLKFEEAFNIRLEDLDIFDMVFLHTPPNTPPTLAYLHRDTRNSRHVKTFTVNLKEKDTRRGTLDLPHVENGASRLVPVPQPYGGILVIGESTICYYDGDLQRTLPMKATEIDSIEMIDSTRYLLGDFTGRLMLLVIEHKNSKVTDLKLEILGDVSIPSTISYLDDGVVFVGSTLSDSQLIRLHKERGNDGSAFEVLETFSNIGPITDLCVVEMENQSQIVTCSGAYHSGSLRFIRNGVGMNEHANIEMPAIKGLFSLRGGIGESDSNDQGDTEMQSDEFDKYLVQSFVQETRVLGFGEDGGLEEVTMAGLDGSSPSLFCGDVRFNQMVQITPHSIRLLNGSDQTLVKEWKPTESSNSRITVATANHSQIIVCVGGGGVILLEVEKGGLKEVAKHELQYEVACMDLGNIGGGQQADIIGIGVWRDMSVYLYQLPNFTLVSKESLGGNVVPRSLVINNLEGTNYVFVGTGDGNLLIFTIDGSGALINRKKMSLATQPIILRSFVSQGKNNIFAASDRPAVIHSSNKRLLCSSVNFKDATQMCPFNTQSLPGSLAISTEQTLFLGSIDNIQKLHIQTVPIESPRRIAHSIKHHCYLVISTKQIASESQEDTEECYIVLIDDRTLEKKSSYKLENFEIGVGITTCRFSDDPEEYFAISTGYILPDETEPSKGRVIILLPTESGSLSFVTYSKHDGAVYCIQSFNGKLAISRNATVEILNWSSTVDGGFELVTECTHKCSILNVSLSTRGDFILVGDIMQSVTLLVYKSTESAIEVVAKEYHHMPVTSAIFFGENDYLTADSYYNLIIAHRNCDSLVDEERGRLDISNEIHLGEQINVFRKGALVIRHPSDNETPLLDSWIFGTTSGVIGLVLSISQSSFDFFLKLQEKLVQVIHGVGGFDHSDWRSFCSAQRKAPSKGFIDGDLIEIFLELSPEKKQEVAKTMKMPVDELVKRVEEMQRLH